MFLRDPVNWVVIIIIGLQAWFIIYIVMKGRKNDKNEPKE